MDARHLIPPPGEPITLDQADAILGHFADHAGELAAGVAVTLRDRGYIVHFTRILSTDELVRFWSPAFLDVTLAYIHYAPSQSILYDAVQIRLNKITGQLLVWDGRGVLG
jgi:hypothetical protein